MLRNEIWLSVASKDTNLCIDCVEKRLGRKLTKEDFDPCDFNFWKGRTKNQTPKLRDRLGK